MVSVDFPRMRQWTSAPRTTSVSKSFESASRRRFTLLDADVFMNVTKCVSPLATGNGSAATTVRSSAALRTNVVTSKPNSSSSARSRRRSIAARVPDAAKTTLPLLT